VTRKRMSAAVVGAGFVGSIHARALSSHPMVDLVGICGRTAPKTDALAHEFRVDPFYSVVEMLEKVRPDVVCVCTGNKDHFRPTIDSLVSGAHVFVEKPMAFDLTEAREMVAVARRSQRKLGVNFNHRFSGPFQRALGWLHAGELGAVCYVDVKFAGDLYKDLNDPYCQLIETQGHSFDLMRLFAGEIAEVSAFLADPRRIGVFTSASVAVRFADGAVGALLGSWDSSYDHPGAQILEVSGTAGRVVVEDVVGAVKLFRHEDGAYTEWNPGLFRAELRDFWYTIDAHIHAFVDCLYEDVDPPVTGEDGVAALELTFAAIESFESGRPVGPQRLLS
jgi:predicted dehydrogenase